jgi:hypothetical protein
VANRKVCGGNRTWNAARTQQILITIFRTAYQQGADAIALLTDLLRSPADTVAPLRYAPHRQPRAVGAKRRQGAPSVPV